ncbi:MAG TPA: DNA alkylation repair protein [Saprospiraceae bacterium]|nr:DNA alkylation repair protein [Saprospiraceae bacterium]
MAEQQEIYTFIISLCEKNADANRAPAMKAYMKNHFEFYGINSPLRKEMVKDIKKKYTFKNDDLFWKLIDHLWQSDERELQYIALDLLASSASKLTKENIPTLEKMILIKSWWDTVDMIAPNLIGKIFIKDTTSRDNYIYNWIDSDNIWLQRSTIIFQLKYGMKTDIDLLSEAILKNDMSKEFFVRKAQGWALRQYGKYNPSFVYNFVQSNPQLSGLTQKEALRSLKFVK